jgi:multiple sugar transport system permease protein
MTSAARRRQAMPRAGIKTKWVPLILLAPSIVGLLALTIYPLISGLRLSLVNYDLLSTRATGQWNWFANYIGLFSDKAFWSGLRLTLVYTVSGVTLELIVGFLLAVLLTQPLPGRTIVRTAIVSAMVMTPVIVGTAWRLMYNPGWGLLTYLLGLLGVPPQAFLAQTKTVIPALLIVDIWEWSPLIMLILMAALQSLPVEPYEAAQVDGASTLQAFRHITLPLLRPAIAISLLMRSMDSFRTFDTIFAMTGGGPGITSQNLPLLSYYTGLEYFHMSEAAAIAVVLLVIITVSSNLIVKSFGIQLWRSQT